MNSSNCLYIRYSPRFLAPYCKQLYIDVTNTNNGKITWSFIKPIIAGKILYGPVNEQTNKIMINANQTLDSMNRLKTLLKGVDTVIKKLRVEGDFREKFMKIVQLADTPLVKMLLTNFGIDKKVLDSLFDGLLYDKQVAEITETIANILECFSVDRFIGVDSKQEMEDLAIELNDKKLFYAGVYFDADGLDDHKYSYTIRMDADNTPGTVDNRDRFWFPGPKAHFELQHRYHRGFIQIQHIIDQAIIKLNVDEKNAALEEEWKQRKANETATAADNETTESAEKNDNDDNDNFASNVNEPSDTDEVLEYSSSTDNAASLAVLNSFDSIRLNAFNDTDNVNEENDDDLSSIGFDEPTDEGAKPKIRRKRQFDFFGDLLGGGGSADEKSEYNAIEFGNIQTFTKQFPYPRYFSDDYQIGVYLAQIIQLLYFFALIGQVANAVRYRVWMKESGNSRVGLLCPPFGSGGSLIESLYGCIFRIGKAPWRLASTFFPRTFEHYNDFSNIVFAVDDNHGPSTSFRECGVDYLNVHRPGDHVFHHGVHLIHGRNTTYNQSTFIVSIFIAIQRLYHLILVGFRNFSFF